MQDARLNSDLPDDDHFFDDNHYLASTDHDDDGSSVVDYLDDNSLDGLIRIVTQESARGFLDRLDA